MSQITNELLDELRDVQLIDNNIEDAERAWSQIEEIIERFSTKLEAKSGAISDYWSIDYKAALVNELNELHESLAECQHGNDKLREEAAAHRKRANILARRVQELERLLEDLTPGGSEFAGDPKACARWVRERLASVGKLAKERNRYRGQVKILTEALQPFARVWESPEPFYPLDLDYERASEVLAQIREATNS